MTPVLRTHLAALIALSSAACSPSGASFPAPEPAAPAPVSAPVSAPAPAAASASGSVSAPAPEGPVDRLRASVLASSQAYETVRSLCDEVGPRLAGSPGERAAVAWGLRTLEQRGLSRVRAEKVKVPRWERGAEAGRIVAPYAHDLALTALGGSVGTPPGGVEAEVVEAPSLEALEALGEGAVKGKIAFVSTRTERARDGSGYGKSGIVRWRAASAAAKLGAVAVVIRSIGTNHDRFAHTGSMRYEPKVKQIPAAALAPPDADLLARLVAANKPVRLSMKLGARTLPDVESANVVGEVVGAEAPDEVVLLGAHLDSWDLGQGAVDDAAGCAIVIEAARAIAALPRPPRRTIRVVLFANEENGLSGARAYAAAHKDELGKHVVALEADAGAGRVYEASFLGPDAARAAFRELAAPLGPLGITVSDDLAHGGADLIPLRPAGVPFVDLAQDMSLYFDVHHTANDTLAQVSKDDLDQAAAAFAALAYGVAEMRGDLGRVPEALRKDKR